MAKQTSILLEHNAKSSWLPALVSIIIVCVLVFIFTKIFRWCEHVDLTPHETPNTLSLLLPETQENPLPSLQTTSNTLIHEQAKITSNERSIVAKRGDTMGKIFNVLGLSAKQLQEILKSSRETHILTRIKPGQTIVFTIKNKQLEKLVYPFSPLEDLIITHDNGKHYKVIRVRKNTTPKYQTVKTTVSGSLYKTAQRRGIPLSLLNQMNSIFSRDVDFKKGLNTGDKFSILYKADFIKNVQVSQSEILAASFTRKGITHEAIRYTNKNGTSSYYTPQGLSLKIGYDRYPLHFSHIASPFSASRYHPILHYRRPHYGIDLAAPLGTPIHAIGDGRIEIMHRESGYGNMVKIRHNDMYSTIYGHLSRFSKGLYRGKMVKRGEIIGYVGQTGLASGPHCHFEFHINKQPKNPTTISLPHADPIPHHEMRTFKQRVHQLLAALHHPKTSISKILTHEKKNHK